MCDDDREAAGFLRFFASLLLAYTRQYDHPLEALFDMPQLGPPGPGAVANGDRVSQKSHALAERFSSPSRLVRRLTLSRRSVNFSANDLMNSDSDEDSMPSSSPSTPVRGRAGTVALGENGVSSRPSGAVIGGWPTPSQRRYIQYFYTILRSPALPARERAGLRLLSVVINAPPRPYAQLGVTDVGAGKAVEQTEYILVLMECGRRESGVTEKLVMRGQVANGNGEDCDDGPTPATPGSAQAGSASKRSVTFECNSVLSRDAVIAVYAAPAAADGSCDGSSLIGSRHRRQMEAPLFSFALHTAFMDEGRVFLPIKQLDIVIGSGLSEQQKLCEFPNDFKVCGMHTHTHARARARAS